METNKERSIYDYVIRHHKGKGRAIPIRSLCIIFGIKEDYELRQTLIRFNNDKSYHHLIIYSDTHDVCFACNNEKEIREALHKAEKEFDILSNPYQTIAWKKELFHLFHIT